MYVYFSLGYEPELKDAINKEIHAHNDIIQGSFDDVYRNNICFTQDLHARLFNIYCFIMMYVST